MPLRVACSPHVRGQAKQQGGCGWTPAHHLGQLACHRKRYGRMQQVSRTSLMMQSPTCCFLNSASLERSSHDCQICTDSHLRVAAPGVVLQWCTADSCEWHRSPPAANHSCNKAARQQFSTSKRGKLTATCPQPPLLTSISSVSESEPAARDTRSELTPSRSGTVAVQISASQRRPT